MNITTRDFLQMLYGKCTEGCITITTLPDSRNEHIPVTELDKAAERIKVLGTSANTYYCVALRQEGVHAIWLRDEPFVIRNENEREQIRELSAGFGMYVIAEGRKKGWKLDNVQDVPRMLRAPGSLNFKSDPPKQCEVYSVEEIRYPLNAFEEFKRNTEIVEFHAESNLVGSAERMCGKCAFIVRKRGAVFGHRSFLHITLWKNV